MMEFKWKLITLTGIMMQFLTCVFAQQPAVQPPGEQVKFSAKEAVDYALTHQHAVRSARLEELKTIARNQEVSGLALPQVSATGNFQANPIIQKQLIDASNFSDTIPKGTLIPFEFGLKYNVSGQASLTQVLFDPSVLVALQARKTLEELAKKGVQKAEIDVKAEVYKAYYNVVAADKALGILRENIERMRKTLEETKATYESGLVEKLDVDRLVVQMNNLVTQEVTLRNTREVGLAALKFQMGMSIKQPLELTDTLGTADLRATIADETGFAYQNRIEYQLMQNQLRANEYNLKRYKLTAFPTLSAFANTGALRGSNTFDYFQSQLWYGYVSYGLNLSVPIFTGLQRKRKADQAWLDVKKSELDLENTRNMIDLDQSQSAITLRNNIRTLENQEENMGLAQEVLRMTNVKYREGVGSSLEVITAETSLLTAQNSYFTALFNAMVSRIDYLKAYGKL